MLIGKMQNPVDPKELRVGVALKYHLQLRELKILRGKSMAATVEMALDHYFSHINREEQTKSGTASPATLGASCLVALVAMMLLSALPLMSGAARGAI
jgi:hypothetical protein